MFFLENWVLWVGLFLMSLIVMGILRSRPDGVGDSSRFGKAVYGVASVAAFLAALCLVLAYLQWQVIPVIAAKMTEFVMSIPNFEDMVGGGR
ncbi:hypothetical protein JW899_02195 [Candidatus Uhrbacteria bacterium]|nr:hypothetical protein [Candidatus Uhrbacteria bacterium]